MQWGRKGLGGSSEEMESSGAELEYWLEELVYLVCVSVHVSVQCTRCVFYTSSMSYLLLPLLL